MRHVLFALALSLAAVSAAGCSKTDPAVANAKIPAITVEDADRELAAGTAKAVDCNADQTRKREGIIPGAILVADEETYEATALPADKASKLIFYCGGPG